MNRIDPPPPQKDWVNILFLTLTPILGVPVLAWYTYQAGFAWWMPALCLGLYVPVGLSICAGYHRYFSHRSYECSAGVQVGYAIFGAMAAQNSILEWCSGHRRHHAYEDSDWDPYNIQRGFWWAHILWIFYRSPEADRRDNIRDLERNPIVRWQHRWYRFLLIAGGFGLPTLIGALLGNPLAGLLWGGCLRIVIVHHSTFLVNSLAHHLGAQTYDENATARDNWLVALLTFGEGYHSFHHRFPGDFRNGIRWYYWDPAKWLIRGLKRIGLAHTLRTVAPPRIEKVRMTVAARRLDAQLSEPEHPYLKEIRAQIARAREAFDQAQTLWHREAEARRAGLTEKWREARRQYRAQLRQARSEWRAVVRSLRLHSVQDQ